MTDRPSPRRRQARGERRIALLLDTAAAVFAEAGYEAATTNAIAARASMSPGSLYQFFANKEAIAEALAARYAEQLRAARNAALPPDLAQLPLDELLDRIVDPLVTFYIANPGFQALFASPGVPNRLISAKQQLHDAVLRRLDDVLSTRAPALSVEQRARCAEVAVQIVQALLPLALATDRSQREAIVGELKKVLRGYLAPILGEPVSAR
jgi:AcrR family transcriptional regulator